MGLGEGLFLGEGEGLFLGEGEAPCVGDGLRLGEMPGRGEGDLVVGFGEVVGVGEVPGLGETDGRGEVVGTVLAAKNAFFWVSVMPLSFLFTLRGATRQARVRPAASREVHPGVGVAPSPAPRGAQLPHRRPTHAQTPLGVGASRARRIALLRLSPPHLSANSWSFLCSSA